MSKQTTVWLPYTQMHTAPAPLEVVRTHQSDIFLADGRILTDAIASWWTACHGYTPAHIIEAIQAQSAVLPHIMLGGLVHAGANTLAARLTQALPDSLNHVFFSESGSVAVEIALKIALQYWRNLGVPERQRFLCFENGYHGDTFYAMSVCDPITGMHALFQPVLSPQHCLALPTTEAELEILEAWLKQHAHELAAAILEPLVQGAGGMKTHTPAMLKAIIELCQRYDVLIILDEIFTGFWRTGSLFAFEQAGVTPDILCLGKALTGGTLPLAATVASTTLYQAFLSTDPDKKLMHGSTFMGHALGCAAANASLDLFNQPPEVTGANGWVQQIAAIEAQLLIQLSHLSNLPGVKAVRIKGAIGAIQLESPLTEAALITLKQGFIEDGVWCRPFGDIVYTTPALTIPPLALEKITTAMTKQVKHWSKKFYA